MRGALPLGKYEDLEHPPNEFVTRERLQKYLPLIVKLSFAAVKFLKVFNANIRKKIERKLFFNTG